MPGLTPVGSFRAELGPKIRPGLSRSAERRSRAPSRDGDLDRLARPGADAAVTRLNDATSSRGGSSGNGIDCSGLARLLHKWIGLDLPRDADMQYQAARPVEPPFELGDLLFFHEVGKKRKVTHVGISLGGWRMIHSSQGNNGVYIDDVQERPSLRENFVSAGSMLR